MVDQNASTDQDADKGLNSLWLKVAGEGVAGDALADMVACSAGSDEWSGYWLVAGRQELADGVQRSTD